MTTDWKVISEAHRLIWQRKDYYFYDKMAVKKNKRYILAASGFKLWTLVLGRVESYGPDHLATQPPNQQHIDTLLRSNTHC